MAGLGCCTVSGSWSGQPQASPRRTRVQTRGACSASSAPDAGVALGSSHAWRRMSNQFLPAGGLARPGHPSHGRSPRRALAEMSAKARAARRNRYVTQAEDELRVQPNGPGPGDPRRERPLRTAAVAGIHRVERPHSHSDHCWPITDRQLSGAERENRTSVPDFWTYYETWRSPSIAKLSSQVIPTGPSTCGTTPAPAEMRPD